MRNGNTGEYATVAAPSSGFLILTFPTPIAPPVQLFLDVADANVRTPFGGLMAAGITTIPAPPATLPTSPWTASFTANPGEIFVDFGGGAQGYVAAIGEWVANGGALPLTSTGPTPGGLLLQIVGGFTPPVDLEFTGTSLGTWIDNQTIPELATHTVV